MGNTPAQYDTILDIGYTTKDRCSASVREAQNATLLVWEDANKEAIWATWDNIVPYGMARLYGVANPVVTVDTMKTTPYATFHSNPQ